MTGKPNTIRTAILGASGYTGAELLRFLTRHPGYDIRALTAERQAGKAVDAVFPHLGGLGLPDLVKIEDVEFSEVDAVFCGLPHGTTQEIIQALPAHVRIVDLSADFRLEDGETYAEWYGHPHRAPELQKEAVYGLTEVYRDAIRAARLVANPGCYTTTAELPLVPLLRAGTISTEDIIIDAKSGVTGAGRADHLRAPRGRAHARRPARQPGESLCRRGVRAGAAGRRGAGDAACARIESLPDRGQRNPAAGPRGHRVRLG